MKPTLSDLEIDLEQSYLEGYTDGAANSPFWDRVYGAVLSVLTFVIGLWIGSLM